MLLTAHNLGGSATSATPAALSLSMRAWIGL